LALTETYSSNTLSNFKFAASAVYVISLCYGENGSLTFIAKSNFYPVGTPGENNPPIGPAIPRGD